MLSSEGLGGVGGADLGGVAQDKHIVCILMTCGGGWEGHRRPANLPTPRAPTDFWGLPAEFWGSISGQCPGVERRHCT